MAPFDYLSSFSDLEFSLCNFLTKFVNNVQSGMCSGLRIFNVNDFSTHSLSYM